MGRFANPYPQLADGNNRLLPGGQLFFYLSGSAGATPKDTYSDQDFNNANANPVIIGADGRVPDIFLQEDQQYQVVFRGPPTTINPEGSQIWEADPVGPETGTGQVEEWNAARAYQTGDIVRGSDGDLYTALQDSTGRDPTSEPTFWNFSQLLKEWVTSITYAENYLVSLNGRIYQSLSAGNQGNDPETAITFWKSKEPESNARILTATTVDGYGVASTQNIAAGQQEVVFNNDASSAAKQIIQVTFGQTTVISATVRINTVNTINIYSETNLGAAFTNYPILITRWTIDT